jgi:hypothetical protein
MLIDQQTMWAAVLLLVRRELLQVEEIAMHAMQSLKVLLVSLNLRLQLQ